MANEKGRFRCGRFFRTNFQNLNPFASEGTPTPPPAAGEPHAGRGVKDFRPKPL